MDQPNFKTCLNAALRILSRRDHSCRELEGKLKQRGYARKEVDAALTKCRRLNYLDDQKYTYSQIRFLRRKGYGLYRIEKILRNKGLAAAIISDALLTNCSESDQISDCRMALAKKIGSTDDGNLSLKDRARLFRFLSQRGFPAAVIQQVLREKPDFTD